MHPMNRKLLRDLWHIKGQVLAIAIVIATGVGVMVQALGAIQSLQATADAYYERYRFADIFAHLKRAPNSLTQKISALPGVQSVEPRIVESAILDINGFNEPATALLSSLPDHGQPILNRLTVRRGRLVDPVKVDEIVVNEKFANAHGLQLGDTLQAVINTQKRTLRVVGVALSPEHTYTIGPGALIPDDKRYAVFWMGERALAGAFDLEGAFNDITLTLLAGTDPESVIRDLDQILAPYGGSGAFARKDQISNWFLMSEIDQLRTMSRLLPTVFLLVAAFLTNMVVARLISTERGVIGLFKAFGYSNTEIGWHYVKFVMAIAMLGIALGSLLGLGLGRYSTSIYAEMYSFPFLLFRPQPDSFLIAGSLSLGAAILGTATAVRRAVRLAPAEAMRPPTPPIFSKNAIESGNFFTFLDQPSRMIVRHIMRGPLRSAFTIVGIGMSVAVMVIALQWINSIDRLIDVYFFATQRQDMTITLAKERPSSVLRDLANMPGVLAVEGQRNLDVRARFGVRSKRLNLAGVPSEQGLFRVYDTDAGPLSLPPDGLVISSKLAQMLDVNIGDHVLLEVLEGKRPRIEVPVVKVFDTYIGFPAYMRLETLNRLVGESYVVDTAHLAIDSNLENQLFAELKDTPYIASVSLRQAAVDMFNETVARTVMVFIGIFGGFSSALAFGVVYNAARIALSERGRELATLRVIGFSRFEISYILLGQSLLLTLIALPIGCLIGQQLAIGMASSFDTELYRMPTVIEPSTYGYAMLATFAAALLSALIVRRRLDNLDLISVLKTRE